MKDGETAILLAASNKHWDVVSRLLDAGAIKLDATDEVSYSYLSCALKLKVRLLN